MSAGPPSATAAASFPLSGVVHLVRPLGPRVRDLASLRKFLEDAPDRALFYHCVEHLIRHPAGDERPPDDFSAWAANVLQDREAAERIYFAAQSHNQGAADLRAGLLEVLGQLVSRGRHSGDVPDQAALVLLAADSVTLPTGREPATGAEMLDALAASHVEVWFYHLIEEPWMESGRSPLLGWLIERGEPTYVSRLEEFASGNQSLLAARERLLRKWRMSTLARRLADAGGVPDPSRRDAGREAVTRLVKRVRRAGEPGR